jgi:hypothetical protein
MALASISKRSAAVGCPPTCSTKSAMVCLMIFASRVRPSASRTAVARENIPTRDLGGFPAIASLHLMSSQEHLARTYGHAQVRWIICKLL